MLRCGGYRPESASSLPNFARNAVISLIQLCSRIKYIV